MAMSSTLTPGGLDVAEQPRERARLVGDRDDDLLVRDGRGPVLARDAAGAVDAALELAAQRGVGRRGLDGGDEPVERGLDLAELAEDGGRVRVHDLLPQARVAAGDAGDVAQALAGEDEVLVGDVGEVAGHQHGDQVREVRDPGDGGVVVVDVQGHEPRAAGPDELDDPRGRGVRALAVRV